MKKLLIAVLFAPLMALAQTYPSPTFNNLTLQNRPIVNGNPGRDSGNAGTDSVMDFGAKSDCANGTGTCTDNAAAFTAAIADAQSKHRSVLIPCGDYYLASGITISNTSDTAYGNFRPNLTGGGARCTHLWFGAGNFNGITVAGTNGQTSSALSMQTISGISISKSDYQGYGFAIENMDHVHMIDDYAEQFNIGVYLQDVQESLFDNVFSEFNQSGGLVALKGTFTPPNALVFQGCSFAANGQYGADIQNPSVVSFNGGSIEENGYNGGGNNWGIRVIYPSGTTDVESNTALSVTNVYFERNSGTADILYSNGVSSPNIPSMVNLFGNNFNRAYNAIGHTATVTIASPAVVTFANHGFVAGQAVTFTTTGALPTGITAGNTYFVLAAGLTTNTFEISATPGGSAINTSGTQSGTHTVYSHSMNVVNINEANGNKTTLSMFGNGFGGLPRAGAVGTTYVPSASTPYISILTPSDPILVCDIGNQYYDAVEKTSYPTGCLVNGTFNVSSNSTSVDVAINNTNANGASILMTGNGVTTPNKYLNVSNGNFNVLNSAFTSDILTLTDGGSMTALGGLNGTAVGNVTPATGAFTTLSASGAITPSQTSGIVGTTTNNNANAGSVGEYICAQVTNGGSPSGCATNSNAPVSLTNATAVNVTSISLTAGDWDVSGNAAFLPAGTTVTSSQGCWISTSSATNPGTPNSGAFTFQNGLSSTAGANQNTYFCGQQRISLSATTTVYLESFSGFTTSTETAFGFIAARRRR